jgi:hypothetical protein
MKKSLICVVLVLLAALAHAQQTLHSAIGVSDESAQSTKFFFLGIEQSGLDRLLA